MKNYICIGGKKIPLTREQVCEMQKSLTNIRIERDEDIVRLTDNEGTLEFIVLEEVAGTVHLLLRDTYGDDVTFGDTNDFRGSNVEKILDSFAERVANIVGEKNLLLHDVDLTALDGLKDYGSVTKKASLLTHGRAVKYVDMLEKYKLDKSWWLATPWSTPTHDYKTSVVCVSPFGRINDGISGYGNCGVRPFCILNSNIFVSE